MEIAGWQQVSLARRQPFARLRALALWTMPVAATVIGDAAVTAALAAFDVAAEDCRAADLDGRHHLQLREAYVTSVLGAPGGAVTPEDVRELYRRAHADSAVRAPAFVGVSQIAGGHLGVKKAATSELVRAH